MDGFPLSTLEVRFMETCTLKMVALNWILLDAFSLFSSSSKATSFDALPLLRLPARVLDPT